MKINCTLTTTAAKMQPNSAPAFPFPLPLFPDSQSQLTAAICCGMWHISCISVSYVYYIVCAIGNSRHCN